MSESVNNSLCKLINVKEGHQYAILVVQDFANWGGV